jgi:hypothetical protein
VLTASVVSGTYRAAVGRQSTRAQSSALAGSTCFGERGRRVATASGVVAGVLKASVFMETARDHLFNRVLIGDVGRGDEYLGSGRAAMR